MPVVLFFAFLCAVFAGLLLGYQLKAGKTVVQMIASLGTWFILIYGALLLGTLLSLSQIYQQIYGSLEQAGWRYDDYLLKALAGALTACGYFLIGAITSALFSFRHRKFVLMGAATYCGICLLLYVVSRPDDGQVVNVRNGVPLVNYHRQPDGTIEIFESHLRFHPRYPHIRLEPLTADIYQEYEKQQKKKKDGTQFVWWKFVASPAWLSGTDINVWLEGVESNDQQTRLYLASAARTGDRFTGEGSLEPNRQVYFTDENGKLYPQISDLADYPKKLDKEKNVEVKTGRLIHQGEIYRFVLVFPPLPSNAKSLTLWDNQLFGSLRADFNPPPDPKSKLEERYKISRAKWLNFQLTPASVVSESSMGSRQGQGLSLSVENIGISDYATFLNVLIKGSFGKKLFEARAGMTSLVDENGKRYRLVSDQGDYDREQEPACRVMTHEDYRFMMVFGRIPTHVRYLTLNHWQFPPILLDLKAEAVQYASKPDFISPAEGQKAGEDKQLTLRIANALAKPTTANIWSNIQDMDFSKLTSALVTGSYESHTWAVLLPSDDIWHQLKVRTRKRGNLMVEVLDNPQIPYGESAMVQVSFDDKRIESGVKPGQSSKFNTPKIYDISLMGFRTESANSRPYLVRISVQ